MWMLLAMLLSCVALWAAAVRRRQRALIARCNLKECNSISLPFVGQALIFFGNNAHHMKTLQRLGQEASDQEGGVKALWMGNDLYVGISDPLNAELVLKSCLEKGDMMKFIVFITGNGSLFAPVDKWRPRRKIVAPAFATKNLMWFTDNVFSGQSGTMARLLRERAGAGPFSVWPYFTSYTFDSICETAVGINLHSQEVPNIYLQYLDEGTQILAARLVSPWLHHDAIYKLTAAYTSINNKKKEIYYALQKLITSMQSSVAEDDTNKKMEVPLVLNIMAKNQTNGVISVQELRDEAVVILTAGTDTSAVGSSFTALLLARHQDVQDRVYQELVEVFGDSERPVTAADLPQLRYLECVIKESLRLYPPVPIILRKIDHDLTLPTGQTLPAGSTAAVLIEAVHRNPRYWDSPARFRPERFLDPPSHPAMFMAFSAGQRNCAGYKYAMMSMKTVLATMLRRYRLLPAAAPRAPAPAGCLEEDEPLNLTFNLMMKHAENFPIQIQYRSESVE